MDTILKLIENILYFICYKLLRLKLRDEIWKKICQFVKFGVIGVSNTLLSYIVYILLVALSVHYLIASLVGFLASVVNAYYWNDKCVFKVDKGRKEIWWKVFLKTFMSYASTGLVLNNVMLILWIDIWGINEMLAPILNLFVTIPLNYILNKYWAFRSKN